MLQRQIKVIVLKRRRVIFEETVEGFVNNTLDSVASLLKHGQKLINVNRDKVKEMSESERQAALKKVEETLNEVREKMKKD